MVGLFSQARVSAPSEVTGHWYPRPYDEYVELEHEGIIRETSAAVLLRVDGEEVWIPKSQLSWADKDTAEISPWIAREKELR